MSHINWPDSRNVTWTWFLMQTHLWRQRAGGAGSVHSSVGAKGLGRWPGAGREKGTYSRTALHRNRLYQPPKRWEKILRHPKTPSLCSFVAVALRDRHATLCVNLFLPEPALGSAPCGLFLLADLTSNLCALCFSDHASEEHCIKPGIVRDLKFKKKK